MRSRILAGGAALALLVVGACTSSAPPALSFVRISGHLPRIEGPTIAGGSIDPAAYRGKIVVLNFWNQDCPPCREEMPVLQRDVAALASTGVVAIGVLFVGGNWPDDRAAARAFLADVGVTYPTVLDGTSELARTLDIAGIPTTVIADRSGDLKLRVLGKLRPGQLRELVDVVEPQG